MKASAQILLYVFLIAAPYKLNAQEIDFSSYENYSITINNISMGDLVFDGPVVSGGGIYEVDLIDSYVFAIEGVKYLDVGVNIYGDGELLLNGDPANSGDPEKSIPFTLKAAYANQGQNDITDTVFISVASGNTGIGRFPVLARNHQPPGPPPPPPTEGFNQAEVEENAYLYFYGEIDVGNVHAGVYSGTVTIQVEYE